MVIATIINSFAASETDIATNMSPTLPETRKYHKCRHYERLTIQKRKNRYPHCLTDTLTENDE